MAQTNVTVNMKHSMDKGPDPYVTDVDRIAVLNKDFRNALWTGAHLQMTLMTIPPGGEVGVENHPDTDQFIRVEQGRGIASMGRDGNMNDLRQYVRIGDVYLCRQAPGIML